MLPATIAYSAYVCTMPRWPAAWMCVFLKRVMANVLTVCDLMAGR